MFCSEETGKVVCWKIRADPPGLPGNQLAEVSVQLPPSPTWQSSMDGGRANQDAAGSKVLKEEKK